jgi:hypothetical protein
MAYLWLACGPAMAAGATIAARIAPARIACSRFRRLEAASPAVDDGRGEDQRHGQSQSQTVAGVDYEVRTLALMRGGGSTLGRNENGRAWRGREVQGFDEGLRSRIP